MRHIDKMAPPSAIPLAWPHLSCWSKAVGGGLQCWDTQDDLLNTDIQPSKQNQHVSAKVGMEG